MEQVKRDKRVIVPMSQAEVDAIDDWRFAHRMPSRAEAIREMLRQLIERALKQEAKE